MNVKHPFLVYWRDLTRGCQKHVSRTWKHLSTLGLHMSLVSEYDLKKLKSNSKTKMCFSCQQMHWNYNRQKGFSFFFLTGKCSWVNNKCVIFQNVTFTIKKCYIDKCFFWHVSNGIFIDTFDWHIVCGILKTNCRSSYVSYIMNLKVMFFKSYSGKYHCMCMYNVSVITVHQNTSYSTICLKPINHMECMLGKRDMAYVCMAAACRASGCLMWGDCCDVL